MKTFKSYIFTKNKLDCTGCSACAHICRHSAIKMQEDEEGFLFPVLDEDKCVKCGLCDMRCPVVNNHQNNIYDNQKYYLITTRKEQYYKKSATIGLCTMLSEYIIDNNGVVFGAYLDETDWRVYHIKVSLKEDVEKIRNSKYAQSDPRTAYEDVKSLLIQNTVVLYIGTPCQIAGLKAFLNKKYDNLFTIDLICHGVYSYKILRKEVEYWNKKLNSNIFNLKFRSKRESYWTVGGIVNFDYKKENNKIIHKEVHGSCSPTYRCYAYSSDGKCYNLRESCYGCRFRDEGRFGDITIGDAWFTLKHYKNLDTERNRKNGVCLCMVNTQSGSSLLSKIQALYEIFEISKEDTFLQPALRSEKLELPELRYKLYESLDKEDYGNLVEKQILHTNFSDVYVQYKKKERINAVKHIIKNVIFYDKIKNFLNKL